MINSRQIKESAANDIIPPAPPVSQQTSKRLVYVTGFVCYPTSHRCPKVVQLPLIFGLKLHLTVFFLACFFFRWCSFLPQTPTFGFRQSADQLLLFLHLLYFLASFARLFIHTSEREMFLTFRTVSLFYYYCCKVFNSFLVLLLFLGSRLIQIEKEIQLNGSSAQTSSSFLLTIYRLCLLCSSAHETGCGLFCGKEAPCLQQPLEKQVKNLGKNGCFVSRAGI